MWLVAVAIAGCSASAPTGTNERAEASAAAQVEESKRAAPEPAPTLPESAATARDPAPTPPAELSHSGGPAAGDASAEDPTEPVENGGAAAGESDDTGLRPLDPSVPVAMPLDQFLGMSRKRIEGLLGAVAGTDIGEGWTRYGHSWALRYERRCAVELVVAMPAGTTCTGPLSGIGFGKRGPPLRRRRACLWPANSIRHSLGKGLAGSLQFAGGRFHAQLVGEARKCRRR